ncbi:hypothetical protein DIPPA_03350 [Diplonema papillatum]|nr:hypothetical protein DIPPA_03350 [Diplonema papillatum]
MAQNDKEEATDPLEPPLPQEVQNVEDEILKIEQYSKQIEDLLRKVEMVQGMSNVGSDGQTTSFLNIFSQLSERRRDLGNMISGVGDSLLRLGVEYKDNLPLAKHIVSLYNKLVNMLCNQVAGIALIAQEGATDAHASAQLLVNNQIRQLSDWCNTQLYNLIASKDKTYQKLSDDTKKKLVWIHQDLPSCIDLVNAKLLDYSSSADVPEMTRKLESDMRLLAEKATHEAKITAYHRHPSLGYIVDGTRRIVEDTSKPLMARLFSVFWFLFCTLLTFCKTALWSFIMPLSDPPDSRSGMDA